MADPEVVELDPSAARDPNDARAKRSVRSLFVGVAQRAAKVRHDVVDPSEGDRIPIAIALLDEIRKPVPIDPFSGDEMLAPGRSADPKDSRNVAVRECRRSPTGFPKVRSGFGGNQLRPNHANENRALGLLIFGRPNDPLRVLIDLIDDLESSSDHGPRM